ncbi:hypothetical protein M405DRAFT_936236 [Rhizopogon salebrosus TDB-379]|nr:hypothetical protein M405DRAFT_936236 [Rhizopogon salebrosus TDB-379]
MAALSSTMPSSATPLESSATLSTSSRLSPTSCPPHLRTACLRAKRTLPSTPRARQEDSQAQCLMQPTKHEHQ